MNLAKKYFIITILLIIPTFAFLLKPGIYWNMHDDMQVIRQLEMEKCINDGQIPCRWTPDLNGDYGYPLFNYYPPLPYLVGEIFRSVGFSFITSIRLTAITQIILSTSAMYLLAMSLFGIYGGLLSAVLYAYAPYRAVNIFVRGAMNESWASVFFPLIFYFTKEIITNKQVSLKSIIYLSISISLLLLSHNPMALIFIPFVGFWSIYWLIQTKDYFSKIKYLALSGVIGLSLSAFYTIPALLETKYVQIETMFSDYYNYTAHFVSLKQLFISNFWGDGASVWGPNDGMSFMIGYVQWLIPILLIVSSIYLVLKKNVKQAHKLTIFLVSIGFLAVFMTHQKSYLIWQILTPIQEIQFPWRFLSVSAFLLAISAGSLPVFLKGKNIIIYLVIVVTIISNWTHSTPIKYGPITDSQKLSGTALYNQTLSGNTDYLPKTSLKPAKQSAKPYIDDISPVTTKYKITGQKRGTDWQLFNLDIESPSKIILSNIAFPNFVLTDFGQEIKTEIEPILGRITVDLVAGNHQLYLKLANTTVRNIANIISILAWAFTLGYFINILWKKLKYYK